LRSAAELRLPHQGRKHTSLKNLCLSPEPVVERLSISSAALLVHLVRPKLDFPLDELVQEELEFCPSPVPAGARHGGSLYAPCVRASPAFWRGSPSQGLWKRRETWVLLRAHRSNAALSGPSAQNRHLRGRASNLVSSAPSPPSGVRALFIQMWLAVRSTSPLSNTSRTAMDYVASRCTPTTDRPDGSAIFLKASSHSSAIAVLHATLRSNGTQLTAVALGK
jgi:hypothetical protein